LGQARTPASVLDRYQLLGLLYSPQFSELTDHISYFHAQVDYAVKEKSFVELL
jgi:hypothetical protein